VDSIFKVLYRHFEVYLSIRPVESEVADKSPRTPRHLGTPPLLRNIKCTRMRHLKKSKIFFSERSGENVSSVSAVAFDGPSQHVINGF